MINKKVSEIEYKKYKKSYKKLSKMFLFVVFLVLIYVILKSLHIFSGSKLVAINSGVYYPVTYVVDGDTFRAKVQNEEITIRMLGINTPETVDPRKSPECYGEQASLETKKLLQNKGVRLELNPNREVLDKYGRYLTYVYLEDGLLLNQYLIEKGFAKEYTYGTPHSMRNTFKVIEKTARKEKKGLWGFCNK